MYAVYTGSGRKLTEFRADNDLEAVERGKAFTSSFDNVTLDTDPWIELTWEEVYSKSYLEPVEE